MLEQDTTFGSPKAPLSRGISFEEWSLSMASEVKQLEAEIAEYRTQVSGNVPRPCVSIMRNDY